MEVLSARADRPLGFLALIALAASWAMFQPNAHATLSNYRWRPTHGLLCAAVFGACTALMLGGRSSPFLYFQF